VIYRALKPNPRLGANFVAMDPLEWLARVCDHIPDPGRHRTLFYAFYSSRARGARAKEKALLEGVPAEPPKKRRCSASWARLISKVYHADPLTCRKCGGKLKIVAYIHSQVAIKKILDHLGLSPPEQERPPPEIRYVPVDDRRHEPSEVRGDGSQEGLGRIGRVSTIEGQGQPSSVPREPRRARLRPARQRLGGWKCP
jgi:hypothetical protein